jgi:hypothetical protein
VWTSDPVPPADAVTFRLRRLRLWFWMTLITGSAALSVQAINMALQAAMGRPPGVEDLVLMVLSLVVLTLTIGAVALLRPKAGLGWVRTSEAGLEFAQTSRAPMFLPWPAVRSVRRRFAGPLTRLIVAPTALDAVAADTTLYRRQWARRRRGVPTFFVEVGMMTPGPDQLFAELDRRLAIRDQRHPDQGGPPLVVPGA